MKTLGERLRDVRGSQSQSDFASSLHIPQTKLSRLERDATEPDMAFLRELSSLYGVSLDWLIAGHGQMSHSAADPPQDGVEVAELREKIAHLQELIALQKDTIEALKLSVKAQRH